MKRQVHTHCRQHEWVVRYYEPQGLHYLNRMAAAVASLGAKRGDYLCFAPTGPAAASLTLQRAAEQEQALPKADVLPRQQHQPAGASGSTPGSGKPSPGHCAAGNSSRSSLSDQPPVKRHRSSGWEADQTDSGWKQPQEPQAAQPKAVHPPGQQRQFFVTKWQGLEPVDSHCYTVPLNATSVGKRHKLTLPSEQHFLFCCNRRANGTVRLCTLTSPLQPVHRAAARYAQAVFGKGKVPTSADAPVRINISTPDGRQVWLGCSCAAAHCNAAELHLELAASDSAAGSTPAGWHSFGCGPRAAY